MKVLTYNIDEDKKVVFKHPINETEIEISLKNSVEVIAPTFVMSGALPTFNYVYIPVFNRFYYVTDVTKGNNDLYIVSLLCDYLMTFAENIKVSYALISRNELVNNKYIADGVYTSEVRKTVDTVNFPEGFNEEPEFILITCGDTVIV